MLVALAIAAMGKDDEPRNKVRFFVTSDDGKKYGLKLWLGRPVWDEERKAWIEGNLRTYCLSKCFVYSFTNLDIIDFADMKEGEIREVFINLDD